MNFIKRFWAVLTIAMAILMAWACSEDNSPTSTPDEEGDEIIRVIDPETGDTLYVRDTTVVYHDTTLRWVGNSALLITEISPLNADWKDLDGDDGAWVEIYNSGDKSANLKGWSFVESLKDPKKWTFGDELVAAKSFRIVFCDKKDLRTVDKAKDSADYHARTHTNWKLDKSGGTLYLLDPSNGIRDSVVYPEVPMANISWGIVDGGAWKYFDKPTPEARNTESKAYDGFAPQVDMNDFKAGFYKSEITLNPPQVEENAKLRCTLDGSEPTASSNEFKEPILISKNTSFRCNLYKDGTIPGKSITKTFFIGETVKMPVVAISVNPEFFANHYVHTGARTPEDADRNKTGLYADVEFPVHVEYFENGSASTAVTWEVDAGIGLMGNYSRLEDKKTVKINMREQYQDGRIKYSLFETRKKADDKYKAFNLRNNGNRFVSDYIADAMGGALLEGSGVDYQRSRQVVVFYNGKYYGIHDMRERFNEHFVESNYGIDAGTVDFIKHIGKKIDVSGGSGASYFAMMDFIANNDFSGENNANYEAVKSMLDVGNYADYMISEMYAHNGDWPGNNVAAWHTADQPWRFMVYDLDHGFDWDWRVGGFSEYFNMFEWVKQGGSYDGKCHKTNTSECFHTIFVKLLSNPDFKRLYANHASVMLENFLNGKRVAAVTDAMVATLDKDEVTRDMEKFDREYRGYKNTCGKGFSVSGSCLKEWAEERDGVFKSEVRKELGLTTDISITIASEGSGSVQMDGMNLPGSTTTSTNYTGTFFGGNKMELLAVPAAGGIFKGWSDGNTDNPRIVTPAAGSKYVAKFGK